MGGWFLFKGGDLITSYRSSKALNHFLQEIYHSKILALSYRSSITLVCTPEKEGITLNRICYAQPDYHQLGVNQTIKIPHLIMENKLELPLNSLGEMQDTQWKIKTKNENYLISIHQNQINASLEKSNPTVQNEEESNITQDNDEL